MKKRYNKNYIVRHVRYGNKSTYLLFCNILLKYFHFFIYNFSINIDIFDHFSNTLNLNLAESNKILK
ncbi:hypothetical protein KL86DYS1_11039 [uncultured Dysgonomonas sp.]|uniref:Uncharacterized protein n=1 Tax=uncultured Dysgonomonas sp. TaxID=206096 RepID=A0A212J3V0_9BACT|nr:hypothetical protein KL86DYS1_11039 [uncultured Dysgonomonas sp.]